MRLAIQPNYKFQMGIFRRGDRNFILPDRAIGYGKFEYPAIQLLSYEPDRYMVDVDPPMADPADMTIPQCVADCEEVITLLRQAHAKWLRCQM